MMEEEEEKHQEQPGNEGQQFNDAGMVKVLAIMFAGSIYLFIFLKIMFLK